MPLRVVVGASKFIEGASLYKTFTTALIKTCAACLQGGGPRIGEGPPIGGQDSDGVSNRRSALYTLCLFEAFPSRGNEKYGEEKQRVIYFMYHFAVSPFGGERSEPITSMRIMPYDP